MSQTLTVVMPIFDGVIQLDFTGPHQFLSRTPDIRVRVASMGAKSVTADGMTFSNLRNLAEVETSDVLLVPGGGGCLRAIEDDGYMAEIVRLGASARYITSVCSGSLILGAAGLLVGRRAACHWAWRELLPAFGAIPDDSRIVRDRNILSGGGVTAGIDFVFALIAELRGVRVAEAVQLGLEYAPQPPFNAGRPDTAPPEVLDAFNSRTQAARAARRARVDAWALAHRFNERVLQNERALQ
jgi:cyclohexyl-isocyanide hydratase